MHKKINHTRIIDAIDSNDLNLIKNILLEGGHLFSSDFLSDAVLHKAVVKNDIKMINIILSLVPHSKINIKNPIIYASMCGDNYLEALKLLTPLANQKDIKGAVSNVLSDNNQQKKDKVIDFLKKKMDDESFNMELVNQLFFNNKRSLVLLLDGLTNDEIINCKKEVFKIIAGLYMNIENESLDFFTSFVKSVEEKNILKKNLYSNKKKKEYKI